MPGNWTSELERSLEPDSLSGVEARAEGRNQNLA